jgi:mutator protein MutT
LPQSTHLTVVAAVVEREGCFLVTQRLEGKHLAGLWEFPGGKCEPGESHDACLEREMLEELGVGVRIDSLFLLATHAYDELTVVLYFYLCQLRGEPRPQLGQEMMWVPRTKLRELEFPPADARLIDLLAG